MKVIPSQLNKDLIKATTGWTEDYHISDVRRIKPEGGVTHECHVSKGPFDYAVYWWDAENDRWIFGYPSKPTVTCQSCGNPRWAGDDGHCETCAATTADRKYPEALAEAMISLKNANSALNAILTFGHLTAKERKAIKGHTVAVRKIAAQLDDFGG